MLRFFNWTQTSASCMEVAGVAIYKFAMGKLQSFLVSYIYVLNQSVMSFSSYRSMYKCKPNCFCCILYLKLNGIDVVNKLLNERTYIAESVSKDRISFFSCFMRNPCMSVPRTNKSISRLEEDHRWFSQECRLSVGI